MPKITPRSPISVGFEWASRISTLGLMFCIPALLGHYLDGRFGTKPIGLLLGMVLGFILGFVKLLKVAREASPPN